MNNIPQCYLDAFSEAAYELAMENREKDPRCRELDEEYSHMQERLRERLDKEQKELMLELEILQGEISNQDGGWIYLKGMADCAALLRAIHIL